MSICDGVVPDGTVGDGLYAVATLPDEVGPYDVMATLTGRTPSGVDVTRQATVTFTVVKPSLALLGTVTTRTVDSNFNGLIDELILDINADVLREGDFLVQATLSAASGTSVLGETRLTLPIGNTVIPVTFTAEKILSLGVDGPYRIGPVEVVFLPPGGAELADRLEQAGETPAFLLTQFEQPLIQFAGTFSDAGVDLDGNGLFNRLDVQLDMVFRTDGFYQWSAILFDSTGRQIDFSASSGFKPT